MTTIHPFPNLPPEIRLQIWQDALRPERPSVQFFTLYVPNDPAVPSGSEHNLFANLSLGPNYLAAPHRAPYSKEFSWTTFNPSAYLQDRGLWTANKESREVASTHYRIKEWRSKRASLHANFVYRYSGWPEMPREAPMTAMIKADDEMQYIVFHPSRDLIVVEGTDQLAGTSGGFNWRYLERGSVFNPAYGSPLKNVALEFDGKTWMSNSFWTSNGWYSEHDLGDSGMFQSVRSLVTAEGILGIRKIWFIDSQLRRSPAFDMMAYDREKWSLADGRELIEVLPFEQGWRYSRVWKFMTRMRYVTEEYFDSGDPVPNRNIPMGVLAYV